MMSMARAFARPPVAILVGVLVSWLGGADRARACTTFPEGQCGAGGVCNVASQTCDPNAQGYCHALPPVCSNNYEPVCGCDGVTYTNDCWRLQTSTTAFRHNGACPARQCTQGGAECYEGEMCNLTSCNPGAKGICVKRPTVCPGTVQPVCGCDGVTHTNDCLRLMAGAILKQQGECPYRVCALRPGGECPAGDACNVTSCASNATGRCLPRPSSCPTTYEPVCGCSGNTYLNDCNRLRAQAPLFQPGVCGR